VIGKLPPTHRGIATGLIGPAPAIGAGHNTSSISEAHARHRACYTNAVIAHHNSLTLLMHWSEGYPGKLRLMRGYRPA